MLDNWRFLSPEATFLLFLLFLFSGSTFAMKQASGQESEKEISFSQLPAAVKEAFQKAYPSASVSRCAQETEDGQVQYEIGFSLQNRKMEVAYAPDGSLLEEAEEITEQDLPEAVHTQIARRKGRIKILEVERVLKDGQTLYELIMEVTRKDGSKKLMKVTFTEQGTVVHREEATESEVGEQ